MTAERSCPRCLGQLFREQDEVACIACGHRLYHEPENCLHEAWQVHDAPLTPSDLRNEIKRWTEVCAGCGEVRRKQERKPRWNAWRHI